MLIICYQFIYTFCAEMYPNRNERIENAGRVVTYVFTLDAALIGRLVRGSISCNDFAIICQ